MIDEPNYRAWFLLFIFIVLIGLFTYPLLTETPKGFYKDASGNNIKIPEGWILADNKTPIPLIFPTPETIIVNITITPTPDNGIYYASESENGTRKLGRYFNWFRSDVLGKKDLSVHVTVYGYKILQSFHYWELSDNKYYEVLPNNQESNFLFIYVQTYLDMIAGDDVRPWLPDENHFQILINDTYYQPINHIKEWRIYELENTYNKNDDSRIQYYGQKVIQALQGTNAGKPISQKEYYLKGGLSNAIDGYIIYEIPKNTSPENITIYAQFYSFGSSQWILKSI